MRAHHSFISAGSTRKYCTQARHTPAICRLKLHNVLLSCSSLTERALVTMAVPTKKLAVVYATKGGMGDVGKFAAAIAKLDLSVEGSLVSLSRDEAEGAGHGISEVDVTDTTLCEKLASDLCDATITHADVDDESATAAVLDVAFEGADAVVACVGSRQSSFGRWVAHGARQIVAAMERKDVKRLVILSSMGIGTDFIPFTIIRVLWGGMLATVLRQARNDLTEMEKVVKASKLDYLLVRPVGLTPEEPPKTVWKVLTDSKDNNIRFSVAKADCARYMVKEALEPTLTKTAVTFASPPE